MPRAHRRKARRIFKHKTDRRGEKADIRHLPRRRRRRARHIQAQCPNRCRQNALGAEIRRDSRKNTSEETNHIHFSPVEYPRPERKDNKRIHRRRQHHNGAPFKHRSRRGQRGRAQTRPVINGKLVVAGDNNNPCSAARHFVCRKDLLHTQNARAVRQRNSHRRGSDRAERNAVAF